jgi:hypothetical protein
MVKGNAPVRCNALRQGSAHRSSRAQAWPRPKPVICHEQDVASALATVELAFATVVARVTFLNAWPRQHPVTRRLVHQPLRIGIAHGPAVSDPLARPSDHIGVAHSVAGTVHKRYTELISTSMIWPYSGEVDQDFRKPLAGSSNLPVGSSSKTITAQGVSANRAPR